MKSYQHSKTFEVMKVTKEAISTNYTTLQYLQTLDFFLWNAINPIVAASPVFYLNFMCKVVSRQTDKLSSKLTSDDKYKLPVHLFNAIVSGSTEGIIQNTKLMYINRGILFGMITIFRNSLHLFKEAHRGTIPEAVIRRTITHRAYSDLEVPRSINLYAILLEVEHWDNRARSFKEKIIQKYTRLAIMQAQHAYKAYNHFVPLDDVVQIYLQVVDQAINRCDSRQGVLTTFIQNWFKSAKSKVGDMCKNQEQSYESLSDDHGDSAHLVLGFTLPDTTPELTQHIAFIAKQVDRQGLVKTALGIPEFLSINQKNLLKAYVV